jgi:hypothetical protein
MTTHHPECEDATGAYAGSCTCAAIKRREALDNLFASDADRIELETGPMEEATEADRKLLCALEAMESIRGDATHSEIAVRAIELWEEGFGK